MPNTLIPPRDLSQESFFTIIWDQFTDEYVLMVWDADKRRNTYNLGSPPIATRYIQRALPEPMLLGERALDCARNFLAALVIPAENRTFAIKDDEIDESEIVRKMFQGSTERDNLLVESPRWDR